MAMDEKQERAGEARDVQRQGGAEEVWPMERWPYGGGAGQWPSRGGQGNDYEQVRRTGGGQEQQQGGAEEMLPMERWPYSGGAGQWPSRGGQGNDYEQYRQFGRGQGQWQGKRQGGSQWPQRQQGEGIFGLEPRQLAQGIGWLSIGLGLADLLAPQKMAEWMGLSPSGNTEMLLRAAGAREIATGVGLLVQQDNPGPWLTARLAGDAMDLALLGAAFFRDDADTARLGTALAAVAGITALDVLASTQV